MAQRLPCITGRLSACARVPHREGNSKGGLPLFNIKIRNRRGCCAAVRATARAAVCPAVRAAVCATQVGVDFHQSSGTVLHEPTLHALFFQAAQVRRRIRAAILFTSVRLPLPVLRSRVNLVEQQFRICIAIGRRLPDAEEIAHAGLPLYRWITGS